MLQLNRRELFDTRDLELTQNTVQKEFKTIMATKKGVNHSNNKRRCSAGNLDDLL